MSDYSHVRSDGCTVTGTMVDGKVHGTVTVTFPNGQTESVKTFDMNTPTGTHTHWDEDGNVTSTIEYENGAISKVDGEPYADPAASLSEGTDGDV